MNKHKVNQDESGFSAVDFLVLVCSILAIVIIGFVVVGKSSLGSNASQNKNHSVSIISYNLPYTSSQTTITTLPLANKIVSTVTSKDIVISFVPDNQVDDIYATNGGLIVSDVNGAVSRTITIDITEQLLAGTATNQGLDIKIGNQYSYDDTVASNGKLSPGPYQIKVKVSDTQGKQIYAYNSKIDF